MKRIKALRGRTKNQIAVGSLISDLDKFEAIVGELQFTDLTGINLEVLKFLAQKPGLIVTKRNIIRKSMGIWVLWGDIRTVDVTVRKN